MGKGEKTNPKLNKKPQKTKLAGSQHNGDKSGTRIQCRREPTKCV